MNLVFVNIYARWRLFDKRVLEGRGAQFLQNSYEVKYSIGLRIVNIMYEISLLYHSKQLLWQIEGLTSRNA